MSARSTARAAARWLAAGAGAGIGVYAALAGREWVRYGRPQPGGTDDDALLASLMPVYDVVDRHRIRFAAPADVTLAAAREMDLLQLPVARAIFAARACVLGAEPDHRPARGLMDDVLALGWRVLAEVPDREIVVGAITRPWEPNPTFVGLDVERFRACTEPESVKIAWTLRADPDGPDASIFRTETRAVATDDVARRRFRPYWALAAPGIRLIRQLSLAPLKGDAERRARGRRA